MTTHCVSLAARNNRSEEPANTALRQVLDEHVTFIVPSSNHHHDSTLHGGRLRLKASAKIKGSCAFASELETGSFWLQSEDPTVTESGGSAPTPTATKEPSEVLTSHPISLESAPFPRARREHVGLTTPAISEDSSLGSSSWGQG